MTVWELKRRYRTRLEFIEEVKKFGEVVLGLKYGGSFSSITKKTEEVYRLFISERYRVKNAVEETEDMPFVFSNSLQRLRKKQQFYKKQGYDVVLSKGKFVVGMSISPYFLRLRKSSQCAIILHEGWHDTLESVNRLMPSFFEEACAELFSEEGAVLFARLLGDEKLIRDTEFSAQYCVLEFYNFINQCVNIFDEGYKQGESSCKEIKEKIRDSCFKEIEERATPLLKKLDSLPRGKKTARFTRNFFRRRNTATILEFIEYAKYYSLILKLFEASGKNFRQFKNIVIGMPQVNENRAKEYIERMLIQCKK